MLIIQVEFMKDIFGNALLDFHHNEFESPLLLHNEYGPPEIIPVERFFNNDDEFSELEYFALEQVQEKILDIGAATGRHALYLQNQGHDITAMDNSEFCGIVMRELGIKKIIVDDIFNYKGQVYDTILMLLNGIGIAGSIEGLEKLFLHLKKILKPTGQLLVDSSDISYLFENNIPPGKEYFGELSFQYEYKSRLGDLFNWLYIEQGKLVEIANSTGWTCQIISEDETDSYLARLQLI